MLGLFARSSRNALCAHVEDDVSGANLVELHDVANAVVDRAISTRCSSLLRRQPREIGLRWACRL
jgi:hypothetical protein